MRGIFFLVGSLALLIVGTYNGWQLWDKIEREYFDEDGNNRQLVRGVALKGEQVKTTFANNITTLEAYKYNENYELELAQKLYSVFPIISFEKGNIFPEKDLDFVFISSRKDIQVKPGQIFKERCTNQYAVDLEIFDHRSGSRKRLLNQDNVAISQYQIFFIDSDDEEKNSRILIEVIRSDTDGDGYLSCNDARELVSYSFATGILRSLDLKGGQPRWKADGSLFSNGVRLIIGLDDNDDGLHDASRESVIPALYDMRTDKLTILGEQAIK